MPEDWKRKIKTSMLTKRLNDHAMGEVDMKSTQIEAARILLKKVAPDLSTVAVGQDPEAGPLVVKWES